MHKILTIVAGSCALFAAAAAHAVPPNDNWADRVVVAALPFSQTVPGIQLATNEPADPELFCVIGSLPIRGSNTVWYEYTTGPADEYVDIGASGYDAITSVYEGSPASGYAMVRGGCNDDDDTGAVRAAKIYGLRLKANTHYSIEVATFTPFALPTMQLAFSMSHSAVYTVTKTTETDDGICDADCSLREAFAAVQASPGAVVVPVGTYPVTGALRTGRAAAVYGAGMDLTVLDANGRSQVILHDGGSRNTFALHDLTLTGGSTTDDGGAFQGAVSAGCYVLDRVAVRNSQGRNGGGISVGDGFGVLSIVDSVVTGNTATASGGGLAFTGGSLYTEGSSFIDNEANGSGGIFAWIPYEGRLLDTTVSGNRSGGNASGVFLDPFLDDARIVVNNSAIVNNATTLPASAQRGGLVFGDVTAATVVTNTVLAGNHDAQDPSSIYDCAGPAGSVLATGYNLVQAPNGCTFGGTGDVTAVDPQLLPLSGGAVPVYVPAAGSPLVDAGDPGTGCEAVDARGVVRPVDGNSDGTPRCDIGAVERANRDEDRIFADGFEPVE